MSAVLGNLCSGNSSSLTLGVKLQPQTRQRRIPVNQSVRGHEQMTPIPKFRWRRSCSKRRLTVDELTVAQETGSSPRTWVKDGHVTWAVVLLLHQVVPPVPVWSCSGFPPLQRQFLLLSLEVSLVRCHSPTQGTTSWCYPDPRCTFLLPEPVFFSRLGSDPGTSTSTSEVSIVPSVHLPKVRASE